MIDQYIPCPVCKTQIPIDLHLLVQGMQFSCPNCQAAIGLSTESRPIVNEAVDNFENFTTFCTNMYSNGIASNH